MCAFLGYSTLHKGFLCYDFTSNHLSISRTLFSLINKFCFGCSKLLSNDFVTLVDFIDDASYVEWFKPGHIYVRGTPTLSLPVIDPPRSQLPCNSPNGRLAHQIGMNIGPLLLLLIYLAHLFLLFILRQLKMFIGL